jgi:hypothetical protein
VIVDGVTITCNNGQVCHFAAGQLPLCYVNDIPITKKGTAIAKR